MPKGSQNDAKMDAQIHVFLSFFKKDEIYEIKPPLGREHDFTGSGHLKMHDKSIQNRCQEKVCKNTENDAKMDPKWRPKSFDKLKT